MSRHGKIRIFGSAPSGDSIMKYFGDGSDGDFTVAAGTTHNEPVTLDKGWIFKNYNNFTIEDGGIWQPQRRCNGTVICVYGDLTINGTLRVNSRAPLVNDQESAFLAIPQVKLCGALKGGNGGKGGNGKNSGSGAGQYKVSNGGTGGAGHSLGGGNPGGGGAVSVFRLSGGAVSYVTNGAKGTRAPIGTTIPYPSTSGQAYGVGGGAGQNDEVKAYGGKGYGGSGGIYYSYYGTSSTDTPVAGTNGTSSTIGGGGIWIFVRGKVRIGSTGKITANGGNGAKGVSKEVSTSGIFVYSGGGGGAGGGIVALVYLDDYINEGTIAADGGNGGSSGGNDGVDGTAGAVFISKLSDLL